MIKKNSIHRMDCLKGLEKVATGSTKLMVADPPYFQGMTHNGQKGSFVDLKISEPFFEQLFLQINRVLQDDGELYFFCDWRGYAFYYPLLAKHLNVRNLIVWDKESGPGNLYSFQHEFILFATKKGRKAKTNKKGANVWKLKSFASGARSIDGEKVHPTQKPLGLIRKIVAENSNEGDLVIDPFSGSGTTAIACKELKRDFIGFELDLHNFQVMSDRINQHFLKQPTTIDL